MKFIATCTLYIGIEADSEEAAYVEAKRIYRDSFLPDSIEIEPDDEE